MAKAEVPAGWFRGVFLSDEGELLGYLKGLYGVHPQSRKQLLFGKYIGLDGKFVGRLRGTYLSDGSFAAEWLNREGTRDGKLGGRYVAGPLADVKAGFFNGGWIELCPEDASGGEP